MKLREIVFIGVGGGRTAVIRQYKEFGTGGFRINGDLNIYVDPGPGAAVYSSQLGQSLENIDIIIISHNHLDHMGDAEVLAEAANGFGFHKKAMLIASKECIKGPKGDKCDRSMDSFHMDMFKDIIIGKPGEKKEIKKNGQSFEIEFTPTRHEDPSGFGFVIRAENASIGYTSDSEYKKCLESCFKGVDVLIINTIKRHHGGSLYRGHLAAFPDAENLIKAIRPDLSVLNHLGHEIITEGKTDELRYEMNLKTGEQVMVPRQGYKVNLNNPLMFPKRFGMLKKERK
jgi:phosphoribosyl 1,2-cyclic phosphodiesterase